MSTNCTTPLGREEIKSRVVKTVFMGIILIVGALLNVNTFLVLLKRKRQHRNVVTIFLLNLTLVSALLVSQVPFNMHATVYQGWVFGDVVCQLNGFSNAFLCIALNFTLVCLTIDRYLAVVKPLTHRVLMNRRTAYQMMAVVYTLSFILAIIPMTGDAKYKYHPGTNHCSPSWSNSCGYYTAMVIIALIFPILGMLVTYTRIFVTLRKKRVLMNKSASPTLNSRDISLRDADSDSVGTFEDTSTDPSGDSLVKIKHGNIKPGNEDDSDQNIKPGDENDSDQHIRPGNEDDSDQDTKPGNVEDPGVIDKGCKTVIQNLAQTELTNLGVDVKGLVKKISLGVVKQNVPARNIKSCSESTGVVENGVALPGISLQEKLTSDTSNDHKSERNVSKAVILPGKVSSDRFTRDRESGILDNREIQKTDNKQVTFQTTTKVCPIHNEQKERVTEKRLSTASIFPLSSSRKAINFVLSRMKRQRAIRHEYKIARTGTILVLSFLVLWMPYVVAHSCFVGGCRTETFYNIATFLVYSNAVANPIIYALTNRAVMQDIRKSMGKLCRSTSPT